VSLPDAADPSAADARVWADGEKLGQVLLNLLTNAIKFTPPVQADGTPGRITVELTTPAHTATVAELRVHDTGIGIPREKQVAIFEPFVQVSTGLTRTAEGTGLGLAISRDLARGMGGDVVVESHPGAGTTFTVRLRRVVTATGERTDRRTARAGAGSGRRDGVERRSAQSRRVDDPGSAGA
jgi:signal transduction histidine kinase